MENNNIQGWHILKYAIFAENPNDNNEIYCVNLLSGTCFSLSHEEFSLLFKFNQLQDDNSILKKFIQEGIVINFDEKAMMEVLSRKACSFSKSLKITICPTLDCNFNCPYCFENHKKGKMSLETQDNIIKLIENIYNYNKIKFLSVTWYGGEPLLGIDIIDSLSQRIIDFTTKNNINYNSNIITNGYLLDQRKVDILTKAKVNKYQITLDGIEETHDKTRHLINGNPTYHTIINNLYNIRLNGQISIRHNVYEENWQDIEKLKNIIKDLKEKTGNNVVYYAVPVAANDIAEKRGTQVDLLNTCRSSKIEITKDIKNFSKAKGHYCGAQTLSFIVVDHEGRLYKCWEDVDKPERSFGNITNWNFNDPLYSAKNPNPLLNYINTAGVLDDKECQNCDFLPICAGGCPNKRLYYKKKCVAYKNTPEEFVLEFVKKFNLNRNFLDK